jgi:hypothetical protein
VTQAKVRILQAQSQLLNDELIDLKNQHPVKCSELVFVQNNPLYDDDDDDSNQQSLKEQLNKTTPDADEDEVVQVQHDHFNFLFPSQSSNLGKKSDYNKHRNRYSDMIKKLTFIFYIIHDKSTSKVLDSFKKFQLHLFEFSIRMRNANIAIKLVTWRISVLISILVRIVARRIIHQINVPRETKL